LLRVSVHGCQMVYLHTRDPNFGIFLRPWKWKIWCIYWSFCIIKAIFCILWPYVGMLWPFGVFYGHLVHFMAFC
jgi:hypothetical protein